jgi:NADPH:quinone reductase
MRAWVLRQYGEPHDALSLEEMPDPVPGAGQVVVAVEAAGLAFPDLLRVRGEYQVTQPLGTAPGSELVGRVRSCGPDTTLAPGTRVMGTTQIGDGSLAELALLRESDACPVPDDLPAAVGATLSANYSIAHHALTTRAQVRHGEVVVVNGGAGGVGSAAIQLAKAAGARVLADDVGADRAQACLDFGADAAVDTSREDLTAAILAFSGERGADVVIDTVGGDVFVACRRAIASEGRIVVVGFTGGEIPQLKVNQLILRNFTVMGVNGFYYSDRFGDVMRSLLDLYLRGSIDPPVEKEYAFADAPDVLTRIGKRQVRGRAVVLVG